jgi:Fur family transcriptional regulator, peroxide stress response regulator
MQSEPNDIKNRLEQAGLRVTQQRIAVYKYLMDTCEHPTAEIIYHNLQPDYPSLSLATIYKTVETLNVCGLVKKIKGTDESVHYDADTSHHNHLISTNTKKIMDFNDDNLTNLLINYFKEKKLDNFTIKEIQLNIIGESK